MTFLKNISWVIELALIANLLLIVISKNHNLSSLLATITVLSLVEISKLSCNQFASSKQEKKPKKKSEKVCDTIECGDDICGILEFGIFDCDL